jgi:hypothetical protein
MVGTRVQILLRRPHRLARGLRLKQPAPLPEDSISRPEGGLMFPVYNPASATATVTVQQALA